MAASKPIAKPSRVSGAVSLFSALLCLGVPGQALAQANTLEEGGIGERHAAPEPVNDKAFDCPAFKTVIAASPDGFAALRGAQTRKDDAAVAYTAASPLFGACEILDKTKIGEVSYSCQAANLTLADMKATIDSCLGETAQHYASNENPNTPYLRYNVTVAGKQGRVMALKTFGKVTLAVFGTK